MKKIVLCTFLLINFSFAGNCMNAFVEVNNNFAQSIYGMDLKEYTEKFDHFLFKVDKTIFSECMPALTDSAKAEYNHVNYSFENFKKDMKITLERYKLTYGKEYKLKYIKSID